MRLQSTKNLAFIREFKDEVRKGYQEDAKSREAALKKCAKVVKLAKEVGCNKLSIPPGSSMPIEVFSNIFMSTQILPPQHVMDCIAQLEGCYELKNEEDKINIINPLFYLKKFLTYPFQLISLAGFNGKAAEDTLAGKMFKLLLASVVFIASIVPLIQFFGVADYSKLIVFLSAIKKSLGL